MKNIWRLFTGDIKRMFSNVVTVIIVLGLVALPSIFSWYNIIACWDVFGNSGNLTVAVANSDDGYQSDLVPIRINIGEQVLSSIRANDQMNWVITDEEDAIDGAKSGRYYAAVVIPDSFSQDMMTFYSDDARHANIIYYTNEKKNAIAPKVTDQGADQISTQVNRVFTETLSEVALGISNSLVEYLDTSDTQGSLLKLANSVGTVGERMESSANIIRSYGRVMETSKSLVEDSGDLIAAAHGAAGDVVDTTHDAKDAAANIGDTIEAASSSLSDALDKSSESYGAVADAVDDTFDTTKKLASDSSASLRDQASDVNKQLQRYQSLLDDLNSLRDDIPEDIPDEAIAPLDRLITRIEKIVDLQTNLRDALNDAADNIDDGSKNTQAQREEVQKLASEARESLSNTKADYDKNLKPTLDELAKDASEASENLAQIRSQLSSAADDITGSSDSVIAKINAAEENLDNAADKMAESGANLQMLSADMKHALTSDDPEALKEVIGADPSVLAKALSAPVKLDRHAIHPVDNFGSAMSPLYTTLALWIGTLLINVALKVTPSRRIQERLDNPTPRQLFIGRYGVVAFISLMQSTCVSLGNIFFLGVQANEPFLYVLCFWVAGLVFSFIIYTLVASFANFGKALAVFLLIIQVSGGGGSYPLPVLPEFVQNVSPYLPITHAVNAMRAAQFGLYQGDYWIQLAHLGSFVLPFIVLGLVLRNPLIKVVGMFVEKVESTKVM